MDIVWLMVGFTVILEVEYSKKQNSHGGWPFPVSWSILIKWILIMINSIIFKDIEWLEKPSVIGQGFFKKIIME